jgi:hypothetical protein
VVDNNQDTLNIKNSTLHNNPEQRVLHDRLPWIGTSQPTLHCQAAPAYAATISVEVNRWRAMSRRTRNGSQADSS